MNRLTLKLAYICGLMSLPGAGLAGSVDILSPDTAHTYAASRISNSTLKWSNREQKLYANITFDPQMYAGDGDSGRKEYFVFGIPGVAFDAQANTFYAKDDEGQPVAVAIKRPGMFGGSVLPAPGSCFYIYKSHGEVQVVLKASTVNTSVLKHHWIEKDGSYADNR
jgi:hypothetical protein